MRALNKEGAKVSGLDVKVDDLSGAPVLRFTLSLNYRERRVEVKPLACARTEGRARPVTPMAANSLKVSTMLLAGHMRK